MINNNNNNKKAENKKKKKPTRDLLPRKIIICLDQKITQLVMFWKEKKRKKVRAVCVPNIIKTQERVREREVWIDQNNGGGEF